MLPRIAHDMAQPPYAVALHEPHRAGIEMRPYALCAPALRRQRQALGDLVERVVPGDRREGRAPPALVADAAQRRCQALGMVLPFGVARDLGADDAVRIGLPGGPAQTPDPHPVDALDRERAGARTIMRANAGDDVARHVRLRCRLRRRGYGSGYMGW